MARLAFHRQGLMCELCCCYFAWLGSLDTCGNEIYNATPSTLYTTLHQSIILTYGHKSVTIVLL